MPVLKLSPEAHISEYSYRNACILTLLDLSSLNAILQECAMPKVPKDEKKKSGPGAAVPVVPHLSSSSTSSTNSPARGIQQDPPLETDFLTGNPGKIRPSLLPKQADIDLKKYPHMRFPHGRVAPDFAKDYVQSWQTHDEKFRGANALHPNESLMSIHNRSRYNPDWMLDAGQLPHRHFSTCVTVGYQFQQSRLTGAGPGICLTLCIAFMIYRRLGMECRHIISTFSVFPTAFVKIQNALPQKRIVAGLLYSHHSADYSFQFGVIEDLMSTSLPAPIIEAAAAPKKSRKLLPYLQPVGHFAVHPMHGPLIQQLAWQGVRLASGEYSERCNPHAKWTARDLTATWTVPRMHEFVPMRDDKSPPDEDGRDKMLHPQIGAHLFAGMQRNLRKTRADGKFIEASPYFLIDIEPGNHTIGHVILVEFNTSNGKITTPRGIFDPNFGWAVLSDIHCSLDFELMLSGIYCMHQTPPPPGSMDFPGALIAYQLMDVVEN